jgi:hypothetical protein
MAGDEDINDLITDPEPLDEDDPEVQDELFDILHSQGVKPEEINPAMPEFREKYAKWLESHRA